MYKITIRIHTSASPGLLVIIKYGTNEKRTHSFSFILSFSKNFVHTQIVHAEDIITSYPFLYRTTYRSAHVNTAQYYNANTHDERKRIKIKAKADETNWSNSYYWIYYFFKLKRSIFFSASTRYANLKGGTYTTKKHNIAPRTNHQKIIKG